MWMMCFSCHKESSSAVFKQQKQKKKKANLDNDTSLHRLQCNGKVSREVLFFPYAKKKDPDPSPDGKIPPNNPNVPLVAALSQHVLKTQSP